MSSYGKEETQNYFEVLPNKTSLHNNNTKEMSFKNLQQQCIKCFLENVLPILRQNKFSGNSTIPGT